MCKCKLYSQIGHGTMDHDSSESQMEGQINNQMNDSYHIAAGYTIYLKYFCKSGQAPTTYASCSKSQKHVFCPLHLEKSLGCPDRVLVEKVGEKG